MPWTLKCQNLIEMLTLCQQILEKKSNLSISGYDSMCKMCLNQLIILRQNMKCDCLSYLRIYNSLILYNHFSVNCLARDHFMANNALFITIWYRAKNLLFIALKHLRYAKYILDYITPLIIVNRSIILLFEMISNYKSNKSAASKTDLSSFANNYILFCVSARLNCHLTNIKIWILNFG